jgi:nicotinate phosphoribosyltransferase
MNTSSDAPYLDSAYKLVQYAGQPCRKRSTGKATWPAAKQVVRQYDAYGAMAGDTLTLQHDSLAGEPLLKPVMRGGKLVKPLPALQEIRTYAASQMERLAPGLRALTPSPAYRVGVSDPLKEVTRQVDARQRALAQSDHAHWEHDVGS